MGFRQGNSESHKISFHLPSTFLIFILFALGFSPSLQAVTVTPVVSPFVLEQTNSDRIVVGNNNILHAVYVEGNSLGSVPIIKYVWSSNQGATWSTPLTLASGIAPALAIDDNGVLGLVYVGAPYGSAAEPQSGDIYYMRKSPDSSNSLPWSSPVKVVEGGASPSLTGYGGTMHLAWNRYIIEYFAFPALAPPTGPIDGEDVEPIILCGGTKRVSVPSLAVAPRGVGQPPIVRVAFHRSYDTRSSSSCGGSLTSGVYVYDRPLGSSSPGWPFWTQVFSDSNSTIDPAFGNFGHISLSLTANRFSSTFFAFYSYLWNGDRVRLARLSSSGSASISDFSVVTGGARALTDITSVGAPDGDSFKIGYTPLTTNLHDNTYVRTGTWSASTGAPSLGTATLTSSLGRSANVVYFDRSTLDGIKGINALYEVKVSETSYRLDVDYFEPIIYCSDYDGLRCSSLGRERACTDDFGDPGMCTCERSGASRDRGDMAWFCF